LILELLLGVVPLSTYTIYIIPDGFYSFSVDSQTD
jgi:hypothetical protein